MSSEAHLFTSESVTEGHPDKMCDQISDGILDAVISEDPKARVAVETLVKTGYVMVAGELTTTTYVEIPDVVRKVVKDIGYNDSRMGFDFETCGVLSAISKQSPDISMGVDQASGETGAGDQGLMFGYACDETAELMPMPIHLAHRMAERLAAVRKDGSLPFLRPDGKTQITVRYEGDRAIAVDAVVVSSQHSPDVGDDTLRDGIRALVIEPTIPEGLLAPDAAIHINPTGRFVEGGPKADAGLTGRKIIVDTYGGMGRHGGGAFSGKDPTKVDRSASYMARHIAKNVVAAKLARRCEIQLAYAIGVAEPVSVRVETFGTGEVPEAKLAAAVRAVFPLRPRGIIEHLDLLRRHFRVTAAYGHFGRSGDNFTWERTHLTQELREAATSTITAG
jgi:S-adenosylmethionine synthetase